jgi:Flp pilus assembly protein TadD
MMDSKEIFGLRRAGKSAEALEAARAGLSGREDDLWFLRAYAWVLYDQVKKIVDEYEQKRLSDSEMANRISPFMREFSKMAAPLRGDTAFSQMLRLAGKVSRHWPDFLAFSQWAGIDNFPDEDRAPFVTDDGRRTDSLQQRFVRSIARETASAAAEVSRDSDPVRWGLTILANALAEDPTDQWLNYYQSKIDLSQDRLEDAMRRLLPILRKQPRAAWPWALLGEILEKSRPEQAVVCYIHATELAREEQEVARVRIRLAELLAAQERFDEAAFQAHLAAGYREKNGFRTTAELSRLLQSYWYSREIAADRLKSPPNAANAARKLLVEVDARPIVYSPGVVDHVNKGKALTYVATGVESGFPMPHGRFPDLANVEPGTIVEIGRTSTAEKPTDWRRVETEYIPEFCEDITGRLERHDGNSFAFLRNPQGDVYVPPSLAEEVGSDEVAERTVRAILRKEKNGKVSWRALKFLR